MPSAQEQLCAGGCPEPEWLSPQEHARLTEKVRRELGTFAARAYFLSAVRPKSPDAPYSLHFVYPDQDDPASELKREAVELMNKYAFMRKDGDPLEGYSEYQKIHMLVTDNRSEQIEPAGALEIFLRTPDRMPHSIAAMGGHPWHIKDIPGTIRATKMPNDEPVPNLTDPAHQFNVWDISLMSVMPNHRFGGKRYDPKYDVMGIMYNGLGLLADAEDVERMVAAIDIRVLRGLQRFRGHWHRFANVPALLYDSRVPGSNKTTVATVHMPSWQADMQHNMPDEYKMIWGHVYENQGVEFNGLRPKNLYDTIPHNPNFAVAKLNERVRKVGTPFLLMDLGVVNERYSALVHALPGVGVHYAVKANPERPILERLAALGSGFEIASAGELDRLIAIGFDPAQVLSSHPSTPAQDIAYEYQHGVRKFAFSTESQLRKIAQNAPGSNVYVRLAVETGESMVPSGGKFGVDGRAARRLMQKASKLGLQPYGVTFHVGSQMERPHAWQNALGKTGQLMRELEQRGLHIDMLDIGGGFPATHRAELPNISELGQNITRWLTTELPYIPKELRMEPGRYLVSDAGILAAEVTDILPGVRPIVYAKIGGFVLLEALQNRELQFAITDSRQSRERMIGHLAAGSCDSADMIAFNTKALSKDLQVGDFVYIGPAGAYTTTYASDFNDLPRPKMYYIG